MWRKNYIRSLLSVPLLVLFATGSVQAQGNVQLSPDTLTVPFLRDINGDPVGFVSLSLISGDSDTNLFVFRLALADFGGGAGSSAVFISPTSATISSVNVIDAGGFSNLTFLLQVPDRVDLQHHDVICRRISRDTVPGHAYGDYVLQSNFTCGYCYCDSYRRGRGRDRHQAWQ